MQNELFSKDKAGIEETTEEMNNHEEEMKEIEMLPECPVIPERKMDKEDDNGYLEMAHDYLE